MSVSYSQNGGGWIENLPPDGEPLPPLIPVCFLFLAGRRVRRSLNPQMAEEGMKEAERGREREGCTTEVCVLVGRSRPDTQRERSIKRATQSDHEGRRASHGAEWRSAR